MCSRRFDAVYIGVGRPALRSSRLCSSWNIVSTKVSDLVGMLVSHPRLLTVPICLEEFHTFVPVVVVAVHTAQRCLCCLFAWTEYQYNKVTEEERGCASRKRTLYVGCMIVGPVITVNADDQFEMTCGKDIQQKRLYNPQASHYPVANSKVTE